MKQKYAIPSTNFKQTQNSDFHMYTLIAHFKYLSITNCVQILTNDVLFSNCIIFQKGISA